MTFLFGPPPGRGDDRVRDHLFDRLDRPPADLGPPRAPFVPFDKDRAAALAGYPVRRRRAYVPPYPWIQH